MAATRQGRRQYHYLLPRALYLCHRPSTFRDEAAVSQTLAITTVAIPTKHIKVLRETQTVISQDLI